MKLFTTELVNKDILSNLFQSIKVLIMSKLMAGDSSTIKVKFDSNIQKLRKEEDKTPSNAVINYSSKVKNHDVNAIVFTEKEFDKIDSLAKEG